MTNLDERASGNNGRAPGHAAARTWVVLCALALLAYSVLRAVLVSFSWDESWTYLHHVLPGMFFQEEHDKMGGNHHLLNVWGMMLANGIFGNSEAALRLPNLVGHAIYLYATARMALLARSTVLAIAAFLLLNVHPYLLDFFSLARGYGLANGWMMLSLWQATCYLRAEARLRHLALGTLCAVLAAMSHVIMVNFLLSFALAFLLLWLRRWRSGGRFPWPQAGVLAAGTALGLALVLPNALSLSQGGSLNFGCGSWSCVLETFGSKFLYHQPYSTPVLRIMVLLIAAGAACSLLIAATAWRGGWTGRLGPMGFGALVFTACLMALFVQHRWLQVPLPQARTALFLLPLFLFVPVSGLVAWPGSSRVPVVLGMLFCAPLLVHQWKSTNLTYAVEWKPSGELARMLDIIEQDRPPMSPLRPVITVATSFESYGSLGYYQQRDSLQWLVVRPRNAPEPFAPGNYYIVEYDGMDQVDTAHWELLHRSDAVNTNLYRDRRWRNKPREVYHEILDMESPSVPNRTSDRHVSGQYATRFKRGTQGAIAITWTATDTLDGPDLRLLATAMVAQPDHTDWVSLVMTVVRDGDTLASSSVNSAHQMNHFGPWCKVASSLTLCTPLLPGDSVHLEALPYTAVRPLYVDDLELWVLQ